MSSSSERFRSFAERYVIARASLFRVGHEQEDAWAAMLDAKSIYQQIARVGQSAEPQYTVATAPWGFDLK